VTYLSIIRGGITMKSMLWILSIGVMAVAACKGGERPAERAQPTGQPPMGGMNMDSMQMSGNMGMAGPNMMPMTRAHMDSMMRMSPGQMSATMAAHDRMMSQMLDRMGADMRSMKMSGDARWNSLVDSVKADLAELPGLHGNKLSARMKAHADRVQRLLAMHEGMMKGT
jgi:hypothetical protein